MNLDEINQKELIPGFHGQFVHSESMTLAIWNIDEGSTAPEHSHPHEQISMVIEGQFELTVEEKSKILHPGVVATIPSNVLHAGRALTQCVLLDIFHPVREDLR
ncbi:MAG: cupin domain-containing protein [Anaerolineales bacterium]|nr:cupin domain-containing protein [Anaerolineales bacterium]